VNSHETTSKYQELNSRHQQQFLALLAYRLTLKGRETYRTGNTGLSAPERLKGINEVQHRILSKLSSSLRDAPTGYSDEQFWDSTFSVAEMYSCAEDLSRAADWAALQLTKPLL
jgi:hypothetical protein